MLWWMQGGMAGSHLRWSVYEDMVNKVWPQCNVKQRCNIFRIMRRDLGSYWRPSGWQCMDDEPGEGPWRDDISDRIPWEYFRQVLARFNPDNQYAVQMKSETVNDYRDFVRLSKFNSVCIKRPYTLPTDIEWKDKGFELTIQAYMWNGEYYIDWRHRCVDTTIVKVEPLTLSEDGYDMRRPSSDVSEATL